MKMSDVQMVSLTIGFFLVSWFYVVGCDRL